MKSSSVEKPAPHSHRFAPALKLHTALASSQAEAPSAGAHLPPTFFGLGSDTDRQSHRQTSDTDRRNTDTDRQISDTDRQISDTDRQICDTDRQSDRQTSDTEAEY